MTTTPDPAIALLAEALDSLWYGDEPASVALLTDDGGVVVASGYAIAEGLLHHPALRAALELGAAWQMAEAALVGTGWGWSVAADGPGYVARATSHERTEASAWSACEHGLLDEDGPCDCDPTPAEALAALAVALEADRA